MSTRTTKGMFENDDFRVHMYEEMHDDSIHVEITLKSVSGPQKGYSTYSYLNFVVPECWVEPIRKLMGETEEKL